MRFSPLKPSRNSSTEKINELYQNFQHLKSRITNSRNQSFQLPLTNPQIDFPEEKVPAIAKQSFIQMKFTLKKQVELFNKALFQLQAQMLTKIQGLETRLKKSSAKVSELRKILTIQRNKNREKNEDIQQMQDDNFQIQLKSQTQKGKILLQVLKRQDQKIAKIGECYEEDRPKSKERDGDTRSSQGGQLGLEEEQRKKQSHNNDWKVECSKLRRLVYQMQVYDKTQSLLVKELQEKLLQKQNKTSKKEIQEIEIDSSVQQMMNRNRKDWDDSRSMIIPRTKSSMSANLKQLQTEFGLIDEENKFLRRKKNHFELQLRGAEEDQQRFQRQNGLLREQIKKLNSQLRNMDRICQKWLTQSLIPRDLVMQLNISMKCRPLFLQRAQAKIK